MYKLFFGQSDQGLGGGDGGHLIIICPNLYSSPHLSAAFSVFYLLQEGQRKPFKAPGQVWGGKSVHWLEVWNTAEGSRAENPVDFWAGSEHRSPFHGAWRDCAGRGGLRWMELKWFQTLQRRQETGEPVSWWGERSGMNRPHSSPVYKGFLKNPSLC